MIRDIGHVCNAVVRNGQQTRPASIDTLIRQWRTSMSTDVLYRIQHPAREQLQIGYSMKQPDGVADYVLARLSTYLAVLSDEVDIAVLTRRTSSSQQCNTRSNTEHMGAVCAEVTVPSFTIEASRVQPKGAPRTTTLPMA